MKYVAAVLSVMLWACACTHHTHTYRQLDASLKQSYDFKPGSYWIYYDSASGRVDSFALVHRVASYIALTADQSMEQVIADMNIYNILPGDGDSVDVLTVYLRDVNWYQPVYVTVDTGWSFKVYNYAPFTYPFTGGTYLAPATSLEKDTVEVTELPSVAAGGNTYTHVAAIHVHNTYDRSIRFQFTDTFYLAPDYGIIKANMHHLPENTHKRLGLLRSYISK